MLTLSRHLLAFLELLLWVPIRIVRALAHGVLLNSRLGPLRYLAGAAVAYLAFALMLVYVFAPLRGTLGRIWLGDSIRYAAERWLATAIYDAKGNFVGTFDARLDSKRDVNWTGRAIELGDYTANPDHKSIPVRVVPDHYWRCLKYHEDRYLGGLLNPYGIDLMGVLKIPASSLQRSIAARRPRIGVGGSTLPMQLARVIYKTPPSTDEGALQKLRRKFGEWWIAPVIYAELTRGGGEARLKEWAANHIWLAQRAGGGPLHGVEVTSRVVFGKEAPDLSAAEQFVLASAVNKPIILQEGSEQLNRVRLDHWRYITKVRAKRCAEVLMPAGEEQTRTVFELDGMGNGPPDPVVRPKLQMALEEHASKELAKQAMANPVLRANVLIPDARYGVREEMKNEFGYGWREHVRKVDLTFDVIANRTFRERVKGELARLNARLAPKMDGMWSLDPALGSGEGKRRLNVVLAAADARGNIVRFFESDELASYFGSPIARVAETGRYDATREARRIASVGKIVAAIALANEGKDGPDTPYTDAKAPDGPMDNCRTGNLSRPRPAKVAFACSKNDPIETRLAQLGQEPVARLIRGIGLGLHDSTPPTTAAVRGLVTASPQKVHQMAGVVLAALTGNGGKRVKPPSMVARYDRNPLPDEEGAPGEGPASNEAGILPNRIVKRDAVPLLRTLLSAPLCHKAGGAAQGTLRALSHWCAEGRPDLKLHFAKTGTDVAEDPSATVDVWIAGGLQLANGRAYSYVVVAGTGNVRQPWARNVHASDIASLAELLLSELAEEGRGGAVVAKAPLPVPAPQAVAAPQAKTAGTQPAPAKAAPPKAKIKADAALQTPAGAQPAPQPAAAAAPAASPQPEKRRAAFPPPAGLGAKPEASEAQTRPRPGPPQPAAGQRTATRTGEPRVRWSIEESGRGGI